MATFSTAEGRKTNTWFVSKEREPRKESCEAVKTTNVEKDFDWKCSVLFVSCIYQIWVYKHTRVGGGNLCFTNQKTSSTQSSRCDRFERINSGWFECRCLCVWWERWKQCPGPRAWALHTQDSTRKQISHLGLRENLIEGNRGYKWDYFERERGGRLLGQSWDRCLTRILNTTSEAIEWMRYERSMRSLCVSKSYGKSVGGGGGDFYCRGAISVWAGFEAVFGEEAAAVDGAEGGGGPPTPPVASNSLDEPIEDELVPEESVDEVVSWFCSSRSESVVAAVVVEPIVDWFWSIKSMDAESRSLSTSSTVSSNTFEHLLLLLTGLSTRNESKSESEMTPITWSSLSTTMIRCTWNARGIRETNLNLLSHTSACTIRSRIPCSVSFIVHFTTRSDWFRNSNAFFTVMFRFWYIWSAARCCNRNKLVSFVIFWGGENATWMTLLAPGNKHPSPQSVER